VVFDVAMTILKFKEGFVQIPGGMSTFHVNGKAEFSSLIMYVDSHIPAIQYVEP
jgi:hypothetical protein